MANPSLQIGNDNWAIKEDNLLGYSTAGTRFVPQPITMTRATLGTRVNPSGLVEDVALLGIELVDCSSFDCANPDAVWNRGTGWEIVNDKMSRTAQSGSTSAYQSVSFIGGRTYKIKYDLDISAGEFKIRIGGGTLIDTIGRTTSGTYTEYIVANSGNNVLNLRAVDGTFVGSIDNVSVKEATIDNLPRVDYTDGTSSLLVEPQRTNLVTYSNTTNQWTDVGITYSVDSTISPDGTLNGSKAIIDDTITSSNTRPMTSVSITSGLDYVFSVFGKADEFDIINLDFSNSAFGTTSVTYNLTDGTVTSFAGSPVSQGVEDYGNGWYRCYVVATAIATGTSALIIRLDVNPTGDGTSGLYLWGADFQQGSYPTSYIKTSGSTVTRNQETYTKTGISDKINSEEGVLFAELQGLVNSEGDRRLSISDGTTSNRIFLYYAPTSNQVSGIIVAGGVTQINIQKLNIQTVNSKIAIRYKANDCSFWVDGVEVGTDTTATMPSGLSRLAFDDGSGNNKFFGKVKQLQIFKTALSDSELATLTT